MHSDGPATGDLDFVAGPQLELDQLLRQLVDRAQDVIATQGRLRGLLAANRTINADLDLPTVLRRIVEAACRLVNARYGALGVLAPDGGLEEFVYSGIDTVTAAAIGPLPTGKGLLGALIDDPQPIRLQTIADDARSIGFPPNHPPMSSFLGVPIRVRSSVFGNLYLTESATGSFSKEDEELVTALAATAGVAIENARLYAEGQRRQDWLRASAEVTRRLLATEGEEPLLLIAQEARQLADADIVTLVLPTADRKRLMVEVAAGIRADDLTGFGYPVENSLVGMAFESREAVLLGDASRDTSEYVHLHEAVPVGPLMIVPLIGAAAVARGALAVGRIQGRHRFEPADLDMAVAFANQAAVALELADARRDQQRIILLEDRDRIARDLHDHVIQRLFATGLALEGLASGLRKDEPTASRLRSAVDDIDSTIRQIRTSIFQLHGQLGPKLSNVRELLVETASDAGPTLHFEPHVSFIGPVDAVVPDAAVDDLVAVTREALMNVARHAHATRVDVTLTAGNGDLVLEIVDDGIGVSDTDRRSGLSNLLRRAERHGGSFEVRPADLDDPTTARGTRLTWTVPLR